LAGTWNARQAADGDAPLLVRRGAVGAAWAVVEPVLGGVAPVYEDEPGTRGAAEAGQWAADLGGRHNPQGAS
jgi:hypothetical protein